MNDEMLTCPLQNFLEDYLPFSPNPQWVEAAFQHLKNEKLIKSKADKTFVWKAYRRPPSEINGREPQAFRKLEDIFEELGKFDFPGNSRKRKFHYEDCPHQKITGEIGYNFKTDGIIACGRNNGKSIRMLADIAVAMEFRRKNRDKDVYDNHIKLVSGANYIMNDDPRRGWMYGITIDDTKMSLWYFSRSHSVKSETFDFTKNVEMCIHIFLSFLYATPEELGYDETIHRVWYNKKWCYVYELGTKEAPRYFRTTQQLYSDRVLCITGPKPRLWRAVEVEGPQGDQLGQVKDGAEVAVKDLWLDEGSRTEGEIQRAIFERLEGVKEEDYGWASDGLKEDLRTALGDYKGYLMEIEHDRLLEKTKPVSKAAKPNPDLLELPGSANTADSTNLIKGSTQTQPPPYNFLPWASDPEPAIRPLREYKAKQHYRLVYSDVGHPLHCATDLTSVFAAIYDVFIALVLLYLAGWVHRYVSTGNIILVQQGDGSFRVKLSDLEYAQDFHDENRKISCDPKTGTPHFLPLEIQLGERLYIPPPIRRKPPQAILRNPGNRPLTPLTPQRPSRNTTAPLKFIFPHDLESLFWVILWVLLCHIKYDATPALASRLFSLKRSSRKSFFLKDSVENSVQKNVHTLLPPKAPGLIEDIRAVLLEAYLKEKLDKADLEEICNDVWYYLNCLVDLIKTEAPAIELVKHNIRVPTDDNINASSSRTQVSSPDTEASSSAPENPPTDDDGSDCVEDSTDEEDSDE